MLKKIMKTMIIHSNQDELIGTVDFVTIILDLLIEKDISLATL